MEENNVYSKDFYEGQKDLSARSAEVIIPIVMRMINKKIESVVDFGCGVGNWLATIKSFADDVSVLGIDFGDTSDFLRIGKDEYLRRDLSESICLDRKYDMCMSLEVAEHIDEKFADQFVENLCNASDIILFSAAIPFQGGTGHVNEQKKSYWVEKFEKKGYVYADTIKYVIWNDPRVAYWYKQNIILFVKKECMGVLNCGEYSAEILDMVHPDAILSTGNAYENRIEEINTRIINRAAVKKKVPFIYKIYKVFKSKV